VSSGFRTSDANHKANGAKNSAHITGEAVDIEDKDWKIANLINNDVGLLDRFDLYMENTHYSPGWVHLSTRKTLSGRRVFVP
jgi:hypothetical protein